MKLVEFLAVKFKEENISVDSWPDDVVAVQGNYEVEFDGWEVPYTGRQGLSYMVNFILDCEGVFKYVDEDDSGEECTKDEYIDFITKNPNFVQKLEQRRKVKIGRIAELNKVAYDAVALAIKLSEESGLPYTCSMPSGVVDLDMNSNWDSSSC